LCFARGSIPHDRDRRFPTLAAVVRDARHPAPAIVFDHGLQCVLDGIEAQARRRI
jgi:hypothetical protein